MPAKIVGGLLGVHVARHCLDTVATVPESREPLSPRLKKLFVQRDEFGLTNDELRDLAEYMLRRDVTSLRELTDDQLDRMNDALEATHLVLELLAARG